MKILASFVLAGAMIAPVFAQSTASGQLPPLSNPPPPPGMNAPGVDAKAPPPPPARLVTKTTVDPAASAVDNDNPMTRKVPELPSMHDDRGGPTPTVTVHHQGENTIQEYSESGRVYMVVITPKQGIPQTYMVDENGQINTGSGTTQVHPVMYKVFEWGKSKPAEATDDSQESGSH